MKKMSFTTRLLYEIEPITKVIHMKILELLLVQPFSKMLKNKKNELLINTEILKSFVGLRCMKTIVIGISNPKWV